MALPASTRLSLAYARAAGTSWARKGRPGERVRRLPRRPPRCGRRVRDRRAGAGSRSKRGLPSRKCSGSAHFSPFRRLQRAGNLPGGSDATLVDIDPSSLQIDSDQIEASINERSCAIMPVHLYGHCCDMQKLQQVARKHQLMIIEDACQAHGSRLDGAFLARSDKPPDSASIRQRTWVRSGMEAWWSPRTKGLTGAFECSDTEAKARNTGTTCWTKLAAGRASSGNTPLQTGEPGAAQRNSKAAGRAL